MPRSAVAIFVAVLSSHSAFAQEPWGWRQVLATPRIGSVMTTVTVDPRDADRVYVGTQEGTVLVSDDGGASWGEHEISPHVVSARSVATPMPSRPDVEIGPLNSTVLSGVFNLRIFSPYQNTTWPTTPTVADPWPIRPSYLPSFLVPRPEPIRATLLRDVLRSREAEAQPVEQIAVCPGATFSLMVATRRALYGSSDEGRSFVRLFSFPRAAIRDLVCDPRAPNVVVLATNDGPYVSRDGATSFEALAHAQPGEEVDAVAFGGALPRAGSILYVGSGPTLHAGDAERALERLDRVPEPSATIRSIAVGDGVWLGTDDGGRVSFDGREWTPIGRGIFAGHQVRQLAFGLSPTGRPRIAALVRECDDDCRSSAVWASDDRGATWRPFFAESSRTIRRIAASERGWWVVTGGELWTTVASVPERTMQRETIAWAQERLADSPPLDVVVEQGLEGCGLSQRQIERDFRLLGERHLAPVIEAQFTLTATERGGERSRRVFQPTETSLALARNDWVLWVQATWALRDAAAPREAIADREHAFELAEQLAFAIRDAWSERRMHLLHLARGAEDDLRAEVRRERVLALEALLEVWLRRSIVVSREGS